MLLLKKILLALVPLLPGLNGLAQLNLVPNPSFEDTVSCPLGTNNFSAVATWFNPTTGSPDYFNTCAQNGGGVPVNDWGNQLAQEGNGYIFLATYFIESGTVDYREYAEVQLSSVLQANENYYWSMYISLADSIDFASNNLGVAFSNGSITSSNYNPLGATVYDYETQIVDDENGWVLIGGQFTAQGGEDHLIIGNFFNDALTSVTMLDSGGVAGHGAGYYLDNVCVTQSLAFCDNPLGIHESLNLEPNIYPNPVSDGIIRFENIQEGTIYEILNVSGGIIQQGAITSQIDVNGLSGVYIMKVYSDIPIIKRLLIK